MTDDEMNVVEVADAPGRLKYRYSRAKSPDGSRWLRQGRYVSYYLNGAVESEGTYVNDVEHGLWRDYHPNGAVAAEGMYKQGKEDGVWRFWAEDGSLQDETAYRDGQEILSSKPPGPV